MTPEAKARQRIDQKLEHAGWMIRDKQLNLAAGAGVPPLDEQSKLLNNLDIAQNSIANQRQSIELGLKQSTAQRQNILRATFSGQLAPQNPNDEPASVPLEHICAERAACGTVKNPRDRRKNSKE